MKTSRPLRRPPFVTARQAVLITAGCLVGALSYPLFLVPNGIAPGGVTGIATILHRLFGLPVGVTSLVLNIPLFIAGFRRMGPSFLLRTAAATTAFSLLIDLFRVGPVTDDPMMSSLFGGVLLGIGLALILKGGATSGGTDLLARVVHQHVPAISVGAFLFAFDCFVILAAGFTMSAEHAMYSMVCVYVTSRVLDLVLAGIGTDKACSIITARGAGIRERLIREAARGVTVLQATGAYSGQGVEMLVCVVGRLEITLVKKIIREEDPAAFMFITDTHETLGEGFRDLNSDEI